MNSRRILAAGFLLLLLESGVALGQQQAYPQPDDPATQQQREVTQPGNNAPVWRSIQAGTPNATTTVQGRETEILIQPPARFLGQERASTAGEAWRLFRNGPVTFYGGWLLVLVLLVILAFYLWKGSLKRHSPPSGRLMRRFSSLEMVVHWTVAISFCLLGITGLIMLFGKHVLLP